jgi:hypothetical protein
MHNADADMHFEKRLEPTHGNKKTRGYLKQNNRSLHNQDVCIGKCQHKDKQSRKEVVPVNPGIEEGITLSDPRK